MKEDVLAVDSTKPIDELCEDIEVVGPGLMLSEARIKLSLTVEEVSKRLNFRTNLVDEIEQDIFDPLLPATFNRGYLRNYAKLVAVDIDEVLSAYDILGVAEVQRSEMQSFSNLAEKKVEHSRLMWISYLIVALLVGLMVLWWFQEPKLSVNLFEQLNQEQQSSNNVSNLVNEKVVQKVVAGSTLPKADAIESDEMITAAVSGEKEAELADVEAAIAEKNVETLAESQLESKVNAEARAEIELIPDISTVVFTFSGDCWVNIYDATGERIAWGVKKLGYVMTITGKAPLKVTLGKPELAAIAFNGKQVDMSSFNVGNIAKFTLPLSSQ
jgi:cytoskeleton protein RodZ